MIEHILWTVGWLIFGLFGSRFLWYLTQELIIDFERSEEDMRKGTVLLIVFAALLGWTGLWLTCFIYQFIALGDAVR